MIWLQQSIETIIKQVWEEDMVKDFLNRKIIWYESTLVACFYYNLRKRIEKDPGLSSVYRIFLEHSHPKITGNHFDIVIKKLDNEDKWEKVQLWKKDVGHIVVAMEFKPWDEVDYKTNKRLIEDWKNDLKKLASLEQVSGSQTELLYFFYTSSKELPDEFFKDIGDSWFKSRLRIGKGIFDYPYEPKKPTFEIDRL